MKFPPYLCKKTLDWKLVVIILGVFLITTIFFINQALKSLSQPGFENIPTLVSQGMVFYQIDFGDGQIKSYRVGQLEGRTVFALLEKIAERENFKIETKTYQDMGILVESIAGVKNGTDNKYWQYWVNGELPMIAADKKEVKGGDIVEWKFATSPF